MTCRRRMTSESLWERLSHQSITGQKLRFNFDCKNYYQKDVLFHTGCVNSIELSMDEQYLASGGDDRRVTVWSTAELQVEKHPKPLAVMKTKHDSNIFAHAFNADNTLLLSGGNDLTCIGHDLATGTEIFRTKRGIVYNIDYNWSTNREFVLSIGNRKCLAFFDTRDMSIPTTQVAINDCQQAGAAQYNPVQSNLIAVAADTRGLFVFDRRNMNKPALDLTYTSNRWDCMFARWNENGTRIATLILNSFPVVADIVTSRFYRMRDPQYYNQHTIKSITWTGPDTVATGSDRFGIFTWDLPDDAYRMRTNDSRRSVKNIEIVDTASHELKGHRSVVNQVRYSSTGRYLLSSGVEKIVKLWSPLPVAGSYKTPRLRTVGSARFGIRSMTRSFGDDSDDDSEESTRESSSLLHYFDRVVVGTGNEMLDCPMKRRRTRRVTNLSSEDEEEEGDDDAIDFSDGDDDRRERAQQSNEDIVVVEEPDEDESSDALSDDEDASLPLFSDAFEMSSNESMDYDDREDLDEEEEESVNDEEEEIQYMEDGVAH